MIADGSDSTSEYNNTLELNNLLVGTWKTIEWNQSIIRTKCDDSDITL